MVGGELVMALAEATGARLLPVDSEHSALFQLIGARAAGDGRAARPDRLRRPVPRPHRPRRRQRRGGARAPDLGDGRADHDRLGDADEQGLRGDRGPPPLRRRPTSGSTSSSTRSRSSTRWSTSTTAPRSPTSATPTCGCRSPTRCTTPSAPTSTCRTLDLAAVGELDLRGARPRDLRLPAPRARGRARRAAPRPACSTPPTRSPSPPSSTGGSPFTAIAEVIERALEAMPAAAASRHFERALRGRRRGPRARRRSWSGGLAARHELGPAPSLGFALLIILHEAGHFIAAKAIGMRVERFFLFFPPKLVSVKRGETEYGIGAIPLGGFVKITGMNPEEELPPEVAAARLLPPAGLEADRRDRRRARVNIVLAFAILFSRSPSALDDGDADASATIEPGRPAAARAPARRPDRRRRRQARRRSAPDERAEQSRRRSSTAAQCAGEADRRLPATTPAVPIVVDRDGERRDDLACGPSTTPTAGRIRIGLRFRRRRAGRAETVAGAAPASPSTGCGT